MTSRQQKSSAHQRTKQNRARKRVQKKKQAAAREKPPRTQALEPGKPRCGLCGATSNLTRTDCCNQWICDDESSYVLFSFARNSCHRNHNRYTLCAYHFNEGHPGRWQDCAKCREEIETEMYVYYGTNEYNFEVLKNPPKYEPARCISCDRVIVLSHGGYSESFDGYRCGACTVTE